MAKFWKSKPDNGMLRFYFYAEKHNFKYALSFLSLSIVPAYYSCLHGI